MSRGLEPHFGLLSDHWKGGVGLGSCVLFILGCLVAVNSGVQEGGYFCACYDDYLQPNKRWRGHWWPEHGKSGR